MPVSINHALKLGIVSGKAAAKWKKPAILAGTRAQASKMVAFDSKQKHEGKAHDPGVHDVDVINSKATQADRAGSMPSKGGSVHGKSYTPGPKEIDQFYQKPKFPAGGNVSGSGSAKVGVRGKRPVTTGGKGGGNASNKHYYGGPKGRDGT
jgi:hypothetical protein